MQCGMGGTVWCGVVWCVMVFKFLCQSILENHNGKKWGKNAPENLVTLQKWYIVFLPHKAFESI